MTEQAGNIDVGVRVRQVIAELKEWEFQTPFDSAIDGQPWMEITRLAKEEKWRLEERQKIIGLNFPEVHKDVRDLFELSRKYSAKLSTDSRLEMNRESDRIFHSYDRSDKMVLKPLFVIALQDVIDYELISW